MPPAPLTPIWCAEESASAPDSYVAFRATFAIAASGPVTFQVLGSSWFNVWLDGAWFDEGPARFNRAHPEYQTYTAELAAGQHTVAFLVNHIGVSTRILEPIAPFLACSAEHAREPVALAWKCKRFAAFTGGVRRVNPQLGFIEWCDTQLLPATWTALAFDDSTWGTPVGATLELGPLQPLTIANPRALTHGLQLLAAGELVETFGYERDDVPARFFLRDLAPAELPPQGVWRRYDLGRVRLMRPRFVINAPAGAVVEFAYAEALVHGRVSPWINLSAGDSCNLDHYIARGGPQEFFPLTPRGGRLLEVHVLAPVGTVEFIREEIVERAYYGAAAGALQTGDALLDRIWSVGVETHRACAEDAITDNPTRERGQWAGDVVTVGMDIAAAAFGDLRLCRRSLVQCAQCARDDGMVAGLCPGGAAFLTTYAAQWINACVHYWELTGDRDLLVEMLPCADRNLAAFAAKWTPDGLQDDLGWGFVDWGYVRNPGASDMGVNLHYFAALQAMVRWCDELGRDALATNYRSVAKVVHAVIARYYAAEFAQGGDTWTRIGYHRAALGLRLEFFDAAQSSAGRAFLREHMLACFPNRHDAPRLSDPAANNPQLITPYFGHYALPELIQHGGMDFVLDQYRTCWGWSLSGGRTTWVEVFDTRWSHCHQWAGCPTWQLSRWLLGLQPRFDRGAMHYDFELHTGSLPQASGAVPIAGRADAISISWTKSGGRLHYTLQTPIPLTLHLPEKLGGEMITVTGDFRTSWSEQDV
ncbi:MAG: hypothetical protein H7A44_09265 [Opitutaceae bacterium]|nr:hypothetical protein [Cephaloticoccus sp.]MCP5530616.1 hypothetical protein [Opitutaceae bacterium]